MAGQELEQIPQQILDNQKIYDEYFDPNYTVNLVKEIFLQVDKAYFRTKLVGFDTLPERNNPKHPLIYASNHSGMAFPWDGMVFVAKLLQKNNWDFRNTIRPLVSPMLSKTKVMSPYLVDDLWKRVGAIDANTLNFETMMHYPDANILIYPEGVPGIGKGFGRKYQLQRVATSFIRMSLKYKTDIIPVSTVNGEYINPYAYASNTVNKIFNKLGVPFLPLGPVTPFVPFQPWLFFCGFPANLTYVRGERIQPYKMIDKPFEEITEDEIRKVRDAVNKIMQEELNKAVAQYGQSPYKIGNFLKEILKNFRDIPYNLPIGWPLSFLEFERKYQALKKQGKIKGGDMFGKNVKVNLGWGSTVRLFLNNPFALAFFIPIFGWIPIVMKSMKKTPKK